MMTFEEFKETLETYDFEVEKFGKGFYVFYEHIPVAHYYTESSRIFLTDEFYDLSNTRKATVLVALGRYIERLPEKKFKYKVPNFLRQGNRLYLVRVPNDDFFVDYGEVSNDDFQARFTDEEIEDLIEEHGEVFRKFIAMCEKVEVE